MSLAFTITPNSINLLLDGRMRTIDKTHANYAVLRTCIKAYQMSGHDRRDAIVSEIKNLIDIKTFIARVTEGRVQISDDTVLYDGVKTHNVIAQRLLSMLGDGFDVKPLARFMDKMMQNPYADTREDLYSWLEVGGLPICEDGDFVAFKKVRRDYKSLHGGEVDNSIGAHPTMDPKDCDSDRYQTCSRGLHFCSFPYLSEYAGTEGRVVIVKINPANVVAIPHDYGITKGRAWTYHVIDEVPEEECAQFFSGQSVVTSMGSYEGQVLSEETISEGLAKLAGNEAPPVEEARFTRQELEDAGELPTELNSDSLRLLKIIADNTENYKTRVNALANAFTWSSSPQGFDFWCNLEEKFPQVLTGKHERILQVWIAKLEGKTIVDLGDPAKDWAWTGPGHPPPIPTPDELKDAGIDTSDIPEVGHAFFEKATLVMPEVDKPDKFEHNGTKVSAKKLEKTVETHGQRGAAKKLGIPRTTLQGWIKKLRL